MFGKKVIDKELIMSIQPTSIASLKSQCYIIADGNVEEAKKLYDYFSSDLQGKLPLFDPQTPSTMDKVKTIVGDSVGWLKENQEDVIQFVEIAKMLFSKKGGGVGAIAPQMGEKVAEAVAEMPPPIN